MGSSRSACRAPPRGWSRRGLPGPGPMWPAGAPRSSGAPPPTRCCRPWSRSPRRITALTSSHSSQMVSHRVCLTIHSIILFWLCSPNWRHKNLCERCECWEQQPHQGRVSGGQRGAADAGQEGGGRQMWDTFIKREIAIYDFCFSSVSLSRSCVFRIQVCSSRFSGWVTVYDYLLFMNDRPDHSSLRSVHKNHRIRRVDQGNYCQRCFLDWLNIIQLNYFVMYKLIYITISPYNIYNVKYISKGHSKLTFPYSIHLHSLNFGCTRRAGATVAIEIRA